MKFGHLVAIGLACEVALGAHSHVVHAQHAATPKATPEALPKFHRSYVPADKISEGTWTQGYFPIDAADFRRLVETVNAAAIGAPVAGAAIIEGAEYSARLVGEDLLVGEATIHLKRNSQEPAMLELAPWSLAMGAAHWLDKDDKPADMGTGADGKCHVLVEGERLKVQWSLRAERTAAGGVGFDFKVPRSPTARLVVDLPGKLELLADQGIATRQTGQAPQRSRWIVEFGGHERAILRLAAEGATPERRPLTLLRQSTTYELAQSGLTARTQLILDIHGEPLPRITVEMEPGLRLIAARYGELQIPFAASDNPDTKGARAVLQLPEPIVGTGRVLQLTAVAPLVVGSRWRLPGLRAEGMAWQEGTITLLVPGELVLSQLVTDGCQQSRIAALPAPASGESLEIQCFRPEAFTEVLLSQPREKLSVASGAAVEVGLNQITCRQSIVASMDRPERRVVEAQLGNGWLIDAVEGAQSQRALEWEVDDAQAGQRTLRVRLDENVSSTREIGMIVRGHRALPASPAFESSQLIMLTFAEEVATQRFVGVRGIEGMELHWTEDADLKRIDPLKLAASQTQLFAQLPEGALFDADAAFARSTVKLERRRASYTADIRIDAAVHDKLLVETYTIQCTPETSRVDRLIVRFSQDREAPLEWNLAGANTGQFSARPLTAGEQAQVGLPKGGEAWEVTMQLARPGPFELRAVRSTELNEPLPISLAQIAEANVQRGTITIRSIGPADVVIKNRRLSSVPAELLEADRYQTARATYQYQPGRDDISNEPAVTLAPAAATQAVSGAWAWHCRLDSRFANNHTTVHWATIGIQTAGASRLQVKFPQNARLHDAWIDDQRVPLASTSSAPADLAIELPPGRAYARLTLYYATPGGLPAFATAAEAPLPRLDIPILAQQWTVWLPPGYRIPESTAQFPVDGLTQPTLMQRLFGILGRDGHSDTFNPLVAGDWQGALTSDADADGQLAKGRRFVQSLGKHAGEQLAAGGEASLNWGQLLALAEQDAIAGGAALLVDVEQLAWIRIAPQQQLLPTTGAGAADFGASLLSTSKMAVLVWGDTIVLTSVSQASVASRQIAARDAPVVFALTSGTLSKAIERAIDSGDESSYRSVAAWQSMTVPAAPPWSPLTAAAKEFGAEGGWSAYTIHFAGATPCIRIVRTAAVQSFAWPIFLGVVAVGIWRRNRPPTSLVIFAALSAAFALLLPHAYGQLASAAFLAALVALSLRLIRIPQRDRVVPEQVSRGSHSRSQLAQPVAGLILAAVLACCASPSGAQPVPAAPIPDAAQAPAPSGAALSNSKQNSDAAGEPATQEPLYRVFVPIDDKQQLAGGKYYVPEELYKRLLQLSGNAGGKPKGWLVSSAVYRGELARDPVTKQLRVSTLTARIDLQVLSSQAEVHLPFPRDAAGEAILGARLDGRPVAVTWNTAGDAVDLGILPRERYRLELDLTARLRAYGASAGFDVAIPPIATATVELSVPPDAPIIEVPTARGQIQTQKDQGRIQAQLGGSDRLSVRWPAGIGMETATANIEVEELIWVKVRPGTTVFDVRFKYRVLEGGMRQVRLLTDPRLQLLPSTNASSPVAAVHVIPGDPQRIDLELARSVSDQVTIDLSFLLTGTSGVGNLQLPRLESSGVRAARRSLAVWVDAALESKEFPGEDSRPMAIADFMAAWGTAETRPQAAYRIPRGEAMWVLATQPGQPRASANQTQTISLGRDDSLLELEAKLGIDGGYLFQLRLDGPPKISIQHVSLVEESVERVARWSTDDDGRTTIFLTGPVTGKQRVTVRARVKSPTAGAFELPRLWFAETKIDRYEWRIYRQSSLLAEVRPAKGMTATTPVESDEPRDAVGTLVGTYVADDPQATIAVDISPNSPQTSATAVTTLERDGDRWLAELRCRIRVEGGVADVLTFQVPPQWVEPFRVEPAARTKLVPIPGETRQQLLVYPAKPIEGDAELRIRGRVSLAAGDRLRVPDVVPQRMQHLERYVILPERLDLQQVTWETVGLSRATLPPDWAAIDSGDAARRVFRVDGDHFQASLRGVQRGEATAQVKLADIHIAWQADGNCHGVACFDVEPAGATSCLLEMPAGHQLVHAAIENLPAQLVDLGDRRWRATLGPAQLPQRLEIVFAGPYNERGALKRFSAPRLPELKVSETLWTVYGPQPYVTADARSHTEHLDAAQQELHRLRSIAAIAQLPAEILGEHLPEEIARWYQPWRSRYAASRTALMGTSFDNANVAPSPEETEARQLDEQIGAIDKRLGSRAPSARSPVTWRESVDLLIADGETAQPLRYVTRNSEQSLELDYSRSTPSGWTGRIAAALLVAACGACAIWLGRGRLLPKLSPGLVVTLIGLAWWLLLAPSIVGLAIVVLGILLALREQAPAVQRSATR